MQTFSGIVDVSIFLLPFHLQGLQRKSSAQSQECQMMMPFDSDSEIDFNEFQDIEDPKLEYKIPNKLTPESSEGNQVDRNFKQESSQNKTEYLNQLFHEQHKDGHLDQQVLNLNLIATENLKSTNKTTQNMSTSKKKNYKWQQKTLLKKNLESLPVLHENKYTLAQLVQSQHFSRQVTVDHETDEPQYSLSLERNIRLPDDPLVVTQIFPNEKRTTKIKCEKKEQTPFFVDFLLLLRSQINQTQGPEMVEKFGLSESNLFSKKKFNNLLKDKSFLDLYEDLIISDALLNHYEDKEKYKFKPSSELLVRKYYPSVKELVLNREDKKFRFKWIMQKN